MAQDSKGHHIKSTTAGAENAAEVNRESITSGRTLTNDNDFSNTSLAHQDSVGQGKAPKEMKDSKHDKKSTKVCTNCTFSSDPEDSKGTGLVDENTLCPVCGGAGKVKA